MSELNDKEAPQGSIFGSAGQSQAEGQSPDMEQKGSTETSMGGGGQAVSQSQAPVQRPQGSQSAAASGGAQAFARNMGKQAAPINVSEVGQKIQGAQNNLQNEADSYVSSQGKANYGLNQPVLEKAVKGDQRDLKNVSEVLNMGRAEAVEQFKPQTATDFQDVKDISTDAGIKNLLRRKADINYNPAEAAFDMGLLRKNADFQATRDQLLRQNDALQQKKGELLDPSKGAQARAQGARQSDYERQVAQAREALIGMQGGIRGQQQSELSNFQRELNDPRLRQDFIERERQAALADLKSNQANAGLLNYLGDTGGAERFFKQQVDPSKLGWQQFLDEGEASQYNNILNMLGDGGQRVSAAGPMGSIYGFDRNAYLQSLTSPAQAAAEQARQEALASDNMSVQFGALPPEAKPDYGTWTEKKDSVNYPIKGSEINLGATPDPNRLGWEDFAAPGGVTAQLLKSQMNRGQGNDLPGPKVNLPKKVRF